MNQTSSDSVPDQLLLCSFLLFALQLGWGGPRTRIEDVVCSIDRSRGIQIMAVALIVTLSPQQILRQVPLKVPRQVHQK